MRLTIPSDAFDAVVTAPDTPSPAAGGPCGTCAFRLGTEANQSPHTQALARLCVEGITEFGCHEKPQLCRGWIAAVNLIAADGGLNDSTKQYREAMRAAGEVLSVAIDSACLEAALLQWDGKDVP